MLMHPDALVASYKNTNRPPHPPYNLSKKELIRNLGEGGGVETISSADNRQL